MTRDTVAAGNGLQEALIEAADVSAAAIQPEMQAFKRRAERLSLEEALETTRRRSGHAYRRLRHRCVVERRSPPRS